MDFGRSPYAGPGLAPSGDATGALDPANVQALSNLGVKSIVLQAGQFYANTTVTLTGLYTTVDGYGRWVTQWNFVGTGDAFRVYNTSTTGVLTGGALRNFTIDGTSAGNSSTGLHIGDVRAFELQLAVQNFSGTGSILVHFDNQYCWTEETHGYLWLTNGTSHIVFDVSGATTSTNSFGYSDLTVEILAKVNQDGIVLQNGALLYNSKLRVKANFQGYSSAQTNAVLRITGTVPTGHPNAGGYSAIHSCGLDVMAECSSTIGTNAPQTIAFGTLGSNTLLGCTGILDFAQGLLAFATTNFTPTGAAGTFSFMGTVRGDFNLNSATVGLSSSYSFAVAGVLTRGKSLLSAVNGNVQVDQGDYFSQTLTQSITINLNPGGAATLGAAQHKVLIIKQAASGGPYTVTWPHTGSPTTTSCTVKWAGGTAPTMSTGAGAEDVYDLDTYDGATWYGSAKQNMS